MSEQPSRALEAVSRRRDFASLDASRSRGRSGPVRVVYAPFEDETRVVPEVAYGIGRSVGTAVVRNQLRRRLRVLMRECHEQGLLGPGRHLVSVGPSATTLRFDTLRDHLRAALADLS